MKPDFGDAFLRGLAAGLVGLLTQPLVVITLVVVIGVTIVAWRRR